MSNPRDNGPLAPRRSLSKAGAAAPSSSPTPGPGASSGMTQRTSAPNRASAPDGPTRPVMTPPYGGNPQPYSAVEVEPGRTFPVPPAPEQTEVGRRPTRSEEDGRPTGSKEEKRHQRARRRSAASRPRTVRRAKLQLMRVDPWSVTKVSLLLSIAFGIMCVVAVFLIFSILAAAGLWDHVNETIQGVLNQDPKDRFDIKDYVGMDRVMGITMLISAIDVVLITALATLGAFLYNMAASLLGGIEVTLAEDVN